MDTLEVNEAGHNQMTDAQFVPSSRKVKPFMNPLRKLQLSIFNNQYIPIDPNPDRDKRLFPTKPITLKAFCKRMKLIREYEVILRKEFQAASRNETHTKHSTIHADKLKNQEKNAYPKGVPYDFNRAVLEHDAASNEDNDYINASYVDVSVSYQ